MTIERRFLPTAAGQISLEKRGDGPPVIAGYGAVFFNANDPGTEFELCHGLMERVMPSAFDRCLREGGDIRGLFNHDPNHLLGRMSARTMKVVADKTGLRYEITPPDTQSGRDVVAMIQRGDLTGSSFSFRVMPNGQTFSPGGDGQPDIRTLTDVECYDVGPVAFPAYSSTTAGVRAIGDLPAEVRSAWDAAKQQQMIDLRGAVAYAAGPIIDSDKWDADAALGRVRAWASAGDVTDYNKYRRAFAWYDSGNAETMGAYSLPHHDIQNGELKVHRKGVQAAMAALLGSRGGATIPDADRKAVWSHLQRHYLALDLEPPEFHAARQEIVGPSVAVMRMRQKFAEVES